MAVAEAGFKLAGKGFNFGLNFLSLLLALYRVSLASGIWVVAVSESLFAFWSVRLQQAVTNSLPVVSCNTISLLLAFVGLVSFAFAAVTFAFAFAFTFAASSQV